MMSLAAPLPAPRKRLLSAVAVSLFILVLAVLLRSEAWTEQSAQATNTDVQKPAECGSCAARHAALLGKHSDGPERAKVNRLGVPCSLPNRFKPRENNRSRWCSR